MSFHTFYWQYDPPALFVGAKRLSKQAAFDYGMKSREDYFPGCDPIANCGHNPSYAEFCDCFMKHVNPFADYCIGGRGITMFYVGKVLSSSPRLLNP